MNIIESGDVPEEPENKHSANPLESERHGFNAIINETVSSEQNEFEIPKELYDLLNIIGNRLGNKSASEIFNAIFHLWIESLNQGNDNFDFLEVELAEKLEILRSYFNIDSDTCRGEDSWGTENEFNNGVILEPSFETPDITTIQD